MPHKYDVNGIVYSTKPLNYNGKIIDEFNLTFVDGKVVSYAAEKGEDSLKSLLEFDAGSSRIGEVALVPYKSPISQSGVLYFETLYDENASCHLALGCSYPTNLVGGTKMTDEELDSHGANVSSTHNDFMFGSKDLEVTGITKDGREIKIFLKGNFII
jgi:aminopeptidase